MKRNFSTAILASALLSATFALQAQSQYQGGMGGGQGHHGGGCCSANDTPGWAMMTPEERKAHHDKIMGSKDYAGCHAYLEGHHKMMHERAKQKGMEMPKGGPGPACDRLKK